MPMKDNKGKNKPEMPGQESAVAAADGQAVSYTPEQRRLLRDGLRIWARVAIRSYMREREAAGQTKPDTADKDEEEG